MVSAVIDIATRNVQDGCMVRKTITIDLDTYERLSRLKRSEQSFSDVIRELVPTPRSTAGDFLRMLDSIDVSEGTLDAIEQIIGERDCDQVRTNGW